MKVRLKLTKQAFLGEGVDNGIDPRDKAYIRSYAIKFVKSVERWLESQGRSLEKQGADCLADVCLQWWVDDAGPSAVVPLSTPSGKDYLDNYKTLMKMFEMAINEYIYSNRY